MNQPSTSSQPSTKLPTPLDYVGLAAAFAPGVLSFRLSHSSGVRETVTNADGTETTRVLQASESFLDPLALIGGIIAIVVGGMLLTQMDKVSADKKNMRSGLAALILVVGLLQAIVRSGILT